MVKNSFGFTLVELMIVVLILGIVAAAAVPSMNSGLNEMKLDAAAREVVSAIQYVQSLSIKEGEVYGVEFFPSSDSFRCYSKVTDDTIVNPLDKKPFAADFTVEGHLQGVGMASADFGGVQEIEFNSLGEPSAGGSVVLSYGSSQKTINVSVPLGKVSVN